MTLTIRRIVLVLTFAVGTFALMPIGAFAAQVKEQVERRDQFGDPLPKGAVARLGTVRLRNCGVVLFSHDGKQLITSAGAGRSDVVFWDRQTGKELRRLTSSGTISSLHLSPDGKSLAAISNGYHFNGVWDTATGKERFTFQGHSARFTSDGKYLLGIYPKSGEPGKTAIEKRDAITGKRVHEWTVPFRGPDSFFWVDDKTVAIAVMNLVVFYDLDKMSETKRLVSTGRYQSFSPDGKRMAVSGPEGVDLWDVASGKKEWSSEQPASGAVVFAADGKRLAWDEYDGRGTSSLWFVELGTAKPRRLGRPTDGPVGHLVFSPDGTTLAFTTNAGAVELRDVQTGKDVLPFAAHTGRVYRIELLPDGRHLATFDGADLFIWDLTTQRLLRRFPDDLPAGEMALASTAAAGKIVTLRETEGSLQVRDLLTGKEILKLAPPTEFVGGDMNTAAVTAHGKILALLGRTGIGLFDLNTGKCIQHYLPAQPVWSMALSADGRLLMTALQDAKKGLVHAYVDVQTGKEVTPDQWETAIPLRPDGQWPEPRTAWLPKLRKLPLTEVRGMPAFADSDMIVAQVTESSNGRFLAAKLFNRPHERAFQFRFWDTTTGTPLEYIQLPSNHSFHSFTSDNRLLVTTSILGSHAWDIVTGQQCHCFNYPSVSGEEAVLVTSDQRFLISGGDDSQVLVWDLTGRSPDGVWRTVEHDGPKRLELWDQLAGVDSAAAHRAIWELAADPAGTVAFLETKLKPIAVPDDKIIARLIVDLGSDVFAKRQAAQALLTKIGDQAVPAMREVLPNAKDLEQRLRLKKLIEELDSPHLAGDRLCLFRGLEILERIGTADARRLLTTLAQGAPTARFTREAKECLERR